MASSLRLTSSKDLVNGLGKGDDPFHLALHLTPTWHKMSGCHKSSNMFPYQSNFSGDCLISGRDLREFILIYSISPLPVKATINSRDPSRFRSWRRMRRGLSFFIDSPRSGCLSPARNTSTYISTLSSVCVCCVCPVVTNSSMGSTFEVQGATGVPPGPVKMYLHRFVYFCVGPHRCCLEICVGQNIYCNWTKPQNQHADFNMQNWFQLVEQLGSVKNLMENPLWWLVLIQLLMMHFMTVTHMLGSPI